MRVFLHADTLNKSLTVDSCDKGHRGENSQVEYYTVSFLLLNSDSNLWKLILDREKKNPDYTKDVKHLNIYMWNKCKVINKGKCYVC